MKSNPLSRFRRELHYRGETFTYFSLKALAEELKVPVHRLPVCLRIVLESILRNVDGKAITQTDVQSLAHWKADRPPSGEIPFVVARILLQDFTGVPLLADLAAMRSAVARHGGDPRIIEPLVPVELVVDHSIQVDFAGILQALRYNMEIEHRRNRERYEFLKWGQQAFNNFNVVPSGVGIVHQVNLEFLARAIVRQKYPDGTTVVYPDTLVGTDSHTTMINGLGIVGWGVGGIEAEAGMLGQPIYFPAPEVVGVHLTGSLREGVTATDLVLTITEMLRREKVVGKFVEFHGSGARSLSVPDRATIGNMAPEYGATIGFWPFDEKALDYLRMTGRKEETVELAQIYYEAQGIFGIPDRGETDYTQTLELDLTAVEASVSGPKRPQDRIPLPELGETFSSLLTVPPEEGGYGRPNHPKERHSATVELLPQPASSNIAPRGGGSQEPQVLFQAQSQNTSLTTEDEMANNRPTPNEVRPMIPPSSSKPHLFELRDGSVVIAAITSCTNTSNPSVMLAAGLVAKKAVERGLHVPRYVKTSLAPGSRVVTEYLRRTGLQRYLDDLGFTTVGYGCTTCIGNSGPLPEPIERVLMDRDIIVASVLSGNRNFEARIHALVKSNFLMSPPLVVAFALAGRIDLDITREPFGKAPDGTPIYLRDIWPSSQELAAIMHEAQRPELFRQAYLHLSELNPAWNAIPSSKGTVYDWKPDSTYIQEPPFFSDFSLELTPIRSIVGARALGIFGDSVTTDHISPAGSIKKESPAGRYLQQLGVPIEDFNSYGSRRGNDRVMTRGTFANLRIRNLMVPGVEGGFTRNVLNDSMQPIPIYDAAQEYATLEIPLIVFAGKEYGAGSSRDWAAKGSRLLGVRAVITESFERIHRSNLVGMGVLPCTFHAGTNAQTLDLDGTEIFSINGLNDSMNPGLELELVIERKNGEKNSVPITARLDTRMDIEYFKHGGILPFMLRQLLTGQEKPDAGT